MFAGRPNRVAALLGALLAAAALDACGGARASFDGSLYTRGAIAFRVPQVPSTWRKIDVSDAALSFRDDANDASILVNARCQHLDDDTPLVALTNHLLMGTTERNIESQEVEPFDAREAMHTRVVAKLDGVPLAFDVFVLKKDGCVYDFVYIVAPERHDPGAGEFHRFARGFHTVAGSGGS